MENKEYHIVELSTEEKMFWKSYFKCLKKIEALEYWKKKIYPTLPWYEKIFFSIYWDLNYNKAIDEFSEVCFKNMMKGNKNE